MTDANAWPSWPPEETGNPLLDIKVHMGVNELFELTHGWSEEFLEKILACNKYKDYTMTGWKSSLEDALSDSSSSAKSASSEDLRPGFACVSSFRAPNAGSYYKTTSMVRVVESLPGERYRLEQCVKTSAPYGDTFRALKRDCYEAIGDKTTRLRCESTLVFLGSVNGIVKKMINNGATGGMEKSAGLFQKTLEEYTKVEGFELKEEMLVKVPQEIEGLARETEKYGRELLANFFGENLVSTLEPWASFIYAALAHLPMFRWVTPSRALILLTISIILGGLHFGLLVLRFVRFSALEAATPLRWAAGGLLHVIYVPDSLWEIVFVCAFALIVRELLNHSAGLLPEPPASGQSRRNSTGSEYEPERQASEDSEASYGVKYDGYKKAIKSAKAKLKQLDENFVQEAMKPGDAVITGAWSSIDKKSEVALQHIQSRLQGLTDVMKIKQQDIKGPVSHSAVLRTLENSAMRGRADHRGHHHPPRHHRVQQQVHNNEGQQKRSGLDTSLHNVEEHHEGESLDDTEEGMHDGNVKEQHQSGNATGREKLLQDNETNQEGDASSSSSLSSENVSVKFIHCGYQLPDLPSNLIHEVVVEEMYENERLQPFRGWGSTWPGHFLPTDRTLRYSLRGSSGMDSVSAQDPNRVVPVLPPGWKWIEDSWRLDLAGVLSDATDNQGWSYGLDFPLVQHPFLPGSGRKKMADFVRRRRWLRTRIPILEEGSVSTETGESLGTNSNEPAAATASEGIERSKDADGDSKEEGESTSVLKARDDFHIVSENRSAGASPSRVLKPTAQSNSDVGGENTSEASSGPTQNETDTTRHRSGESRMLNEDDSSKEEDIGIGEGGGGSVASSISAALQQDLILSTDGSPTEEFNHCVKPVS